MSNLAILGGRVLDPGQVPSLKVALGLTDTASAFADGAATAPLVLEQGAALSLARSGRVNSSRHR